MPVGDIMVFDIKDTCSCHLIATRLDTTLVLDNVFNKTNEQKYYCTLMSSLLQGKILLRIVSFYEL